jgi:uncharacterized spore protein YtfJ
MEEQNRQAAPALEGEATEELCEPDALDSFFQAMYEAVGVDTVFGAPVTVGDRVIIPVAETGMGGGLGMGQGPQRKDGESGPISIGLSAGGGGGASSRPVAVVVVTPDRVRVEPIFDLSKIALAGIANSVGVWKGMTAFAAALRKRH